MLTFDGSQHRFPFARKGNSASEFAAAIVSAGVRLGIPATVLSDGDAGLWKLQRQVVPEATPRLVAHRHALRARLAVGTRHR